MSILLTTLCSILFMGEISSASIDLGISPCNSDDSDCLLKNSKVLYELGIKGDTDLGVKTSDPMYLEKIDGQFSDIHYILKNTTIRGFADCDIRKALLSEDKRQATFNVFCPELKLVGQYNVTGKVLEMPIEGDGDYKFNLHGFDITTKADLKIRTGDDGNRHISFTRVSVDGNLTKGIDFYVDNLFGGNKQLADPALKFLNENWKPIADALQLPALEAFWKEIFQSMNKLLKNIPANKILK